jgi:hypothetical protein
VLSIHLAKRVFTIARWQELTIPERLVSGKAFFEAAACDDCRIYHENFSITISSKKEKCSRFATAYIKKIDQRET